VNRSKTLLLLVAIVLLGTGLRLFKIGKESFWFDEMASVRIARAAWPGPFFRELRSDDPYHPPLYFLILRQWRSLVGESEGKLRLLSAIFGVLALPVIYLIGAEMFNRRVGILSALFLAVSGENIRLAQEARCYTLLVFLALVSCYFFLRWVLKGSSRLGILYLIVSVAGLYTSYLFTLILFFQFLFYLLTLRTVRVRPWAIVSGFAAMALLFLPWARSFIGATGNLFFGRVMFQASSVPSLKQVLGTYIALVGGNSITTALLFLVMLLGAFAVERGEARWHWTRPLDSLEGTTLRMEGVLRNSFLWVWLVVPVFAIYFISVFVQPIFGPGRYTLYVSPAFYLLLARGISRNRAIGALALVLTLGLAVHGSFAYFSTQHKPGWKELAPFLSKEAREGEPILLRKFNVWEAEHYLPHRLSINALKQPEDISGAINEWLEQRPRLWVIIVRDDGSWKSALLATPGIEVIEYQFNQIDLYCVRPERQGKDYRPAARQTLKNASGK